MLSPLYSPGPERETTTVPKEGVRTPPNAEVQRLEQKEKELREALQLLFDLLEQYAPGWYTEEYRESAQRALRS